ncbi:unnamed protein product, partial [Iphiclides podalirius]
MAQQLPVITPASLKSTKMRGSRLLIILQLVYITNCMDQLHIVYEWKQLDFQFPTPEDRQQAVESGAFVPENCMPMGVEVYDGRLFITVPRWRSGVPASLAYINLKDNSTMSPKLMPYPNWAAHTPGADGKSEIVSPFRVRADRCGRLWVLDSGKTDSLGNGTVKYPPALLIYDLKTDRLLRTYVLPKEQVKEDSGFATIAVEDRDCEDTYVYSGDVGKAGVVVYSWAKNSSWRISHHYFHPDPLACDFSVKGHNFSWTDAIFGLGLSGPNADNYSTLYFHPMASYNEFSVSTEYLRNQSVADGNFDAFKLLGSRGPNAQSSVSFVDPKTGVLFYSLVNLNAVACWRTTNKAYDMKNQGRIYMNDETMVYPTDIKVDYDNNLWVLSNRMPVWMYGKLDPNEVNYRVFSAPVLDAISHTACDVTPRSDILDKFVNKIKNVTNKIATKINPNSAAEKELRTFKAKCFRCLRGPNLMKTLVVAGCVAIVVQQISVCVNKLIDIPITTYTHFDFNKTVLYPSVTFCREPPYKYEELLDYGLYSHPRYTSAWINFNFSAVSLDRLWQETTYDESEFFVQYGLEGSADNVAITSTLGFVTGRCFTLSPKILSGHASKASGYSITLQHRALDVSTSTSIYPPGYHVFVHYTREPYTEVEVYNGGLVDYMYINTGETIDAKLTVDEYVKISKEDDPCTYLSDYSANDCTTQFVWDRVGNQVGCSGPWMRSSLPRCNNYTAIRNLISAYMNTYNNHGCDMCPRFCRSYLYNVFVTDRQSFYAWDASINLWHFKTDSVTLQSQNGWQLLQLFIHFNSMMVSVYEERYNYDWNLFVSDLGGSIGFLLGLSVISVMSILGSVWFEIIKPLIVKKKVRKDIMSVTGSTSTTDVAIIYKDHKLYEDDFGKVSARKLTISDRQFSNGPQRCMECTSAPSVEYNVGE